MTINLEQIDLLRQRANVSYEDAKEALEQCNYDIVEALVYLERQKKVRAQQVPPSGENTFMNSVKHLIKKGNETKFVIKKKEDVVLKVPVNVAIISTVFFPPITIVGVTAALLTNHSVKFEKPDGAQVDVNAAINKMSTAITTTTTQAVDNFNKEA